MAVKVDSKVCLHSVALRGCRLSGVDLEMSALPLSLRIPSHVGRGVPLGQLRGVV